MTHLVFYRADQKLKVYADDGSEEVPKIGGWRAANNVDSHSNGPWPVGIFSFLEWIRPLPVDGPASSLGKHGILIFGVKDRPGMGVHSGRAGVKDGLGREGFEHCTEGCIRTEDPMMAALTELHGSDPIRTLQVLP